MVGENWLRVALYAMALGVGLYIIPLGMIANPDLIALPDRTGFALFAAVKVGLGLAAISYGVIGQFHAPARLALLSVGAALIFIVVEFD